MSTFKPWILDLKIAAICIAISVVAMGAQWAWPNFALRNFLLSSAVIFGVGGVFFFRRFARRWHGQVVEGRAQRALGKRLPDGWSLQCNLPLATGGDLDGLLQGPGGQSFALEIKSKVSVKVIKGSLWGKDKLVDAKGFALDSRPFIQVTRNAVEMESVPVLWFPDAVVKSFSKNIQGVAVVCGSAGHLMKSLGVPSRSLW